MGAARARANILHPSSLGGLLRTIYLRSIARSAARDRTCLQSLDRSRQVSNVLEIKSRLVRRELRLCEWTPQRGNRCNARTVSRRNVVRRVADKNGFVRLI